MPRDCVCKILLGVKDKEGKKEEEEKKNDGQWFPQNTLTMLSLGSSTLGMQVSHGFTAQSQKLARYFFAKGVFNCKDESRGEKKKKRSSNLSTVSHKRTAVGQV